MNNRKGFTLVEVIVILAVIAILAAIAVPVALKIFEKTAEDATRDEMANLKKAMVGDPQKLQSSFRSDFGFLGDIGCLPTVLDRLLTAGSLPTPYTFDSTKQAGAGWKGPYITGAAQGDELAEFTKDQLGNAYTYSASGGCPLTATLTSNGANGIFESMSGDDITISIASTETTATVRGTVKNTSGVGLASVPVEFYSAVGGTLTTTAGNTDGNGNYSFSSVPFGPRAVRAVPFLVFVPGSVTTNGGRTNISFNVMNYSTSIYTITQIRADFSGGANYDTIRINGNTVDSGNNFVTGQVVNVTSTNIAASPVTIPSKRVFVDSPDTQLPDITLLNGTSATIELNAFNRNMQGITITVTFNPSGTSSVATFVVP